MSNDAKTVILIADDEPSTLALLGRHLRSRGHSVLEAADGDEAWELAHEHLPDLVILDVMMPGMSGWEVCRKVREAVSLAHTGVIMLTGIGETLNEMTSPLYGADAYVDKPFEFAALDARVGEVLERRRAGAFGRPDHADEEVRVALPHDSRAPVAKAMPSARKPAAARPMAAPSTKKAVNAEPKAAAKLAPTKAKARPEKKPAPPPGPMKKASKVKGPPTTARGKASKAKAAPPKAKPVKKAPAPKAKGKPAKAAPAPRTKAKPAKAAPAPKAKAKPARKAPAPKAKGKPAKAAPAPKAKAKAKPKPKPEKKRR